MGDDGTPGARDGTRSPGLSMVDEEAGLALGRGGAVPTPPPGYITKDTQVFITSEPVGGGGGGVQEGDESQRAPSESSSTRYLKS